MCEEANREFGDDKVLSFEKLSKGFPFIKAFLHETLRLKNPAFAVVRYSLEEYQFGDYKIPKNSELILCLFNAAADEKIWGKDVEEFRPERFLEGNIDTRFSSFLFKFKDIPFLHFQWVQEFVLEEDFLKWK
jgi:cytochrome P450